MPDTDLELRRMGDSAAMTDEELSRTIRIAQDLAKSEMFKADPSKSVTPHQAFAKILIGRDLGISPTQALMGIDLVRGNIQMRAVLLASFVRKSADYDYKVLEHDAQHCKIEFRYADGREPDISEFTMADADRAGLTKPTRSGEPSMYAKHPKNMLWARAMSNGVKWFCPDLTGGIPVYTEADVFESTATEIGSGRGDGSEPGWGATSPSSAAAVEAIIARARHLGHAGLSDLATAQMSLSGQPDSVVAMWVERAGRELAEFQAGKASADVRDRLRAAGWHETDDGLWTAEGVAVPMDLSGATKILAAIEAQRPVVTVHDDGMVTTAIDGKTVRAVQQDPPDREALREELGTILDRIAAEEEAGADEAVMAPLYAEQERLERALGHDEPGDEQTEIPL